MMQKRWILDTLTNEIDDVSSHIIIYTPTLMDCNRFLFDLDVFNQEMATLVKLIYN